MKTAYTYAAKQLLGMSFEPFTYMAPDGMLYTWAGGWAQYLCGLLLALGLNSIAEWVFVRTVKVSMLLYGAQAVLTHILANIDGGNLIVAFTYDNATLRIASVHVENNSTAIYFVSAKAKATGKVYNLSIAPGIIDQSIPQTVANRLQLSVRPSGRLDGVEWSIQ